MDAIRFTQIQVVELGGENYMVSITTEIRKMPKPDEVMLSAEELGPKCT